MADEPEDKEQHNLVVENFADKEADDDDVRPELTIPPRDRKIHHPAFDLVVGSLEEQITDGQLILQDEYQRRQIWDSKKSSRLIESLFECSNSGLLFC